MAKKKKNRGGIIFSTDPDFEDDFYDDEVEETPEPSRQNLRVSRQRIKGNKVITLITGFEGADSDLKDLGKKLKSLCGCGGTVKDGEIILQGDFREKVGTELGKSGYRYKFSGG